MRVVTFSVLNFMKEDIYKFKLHPIKPSIFIKVLVDINTVILVSSDKYSFIFFPSLERPPPSEFLFYVIYVEIRSFIHKKNK